jgi:hypothetical protein
MIREHCKIGLARTRFLALLGEARQPRSFLWQEKRSAKKVAQSPYL